jgi:putative transposase
MEIDEKWQTGHKYFDVADYLTWRKEQGEQAKDTTRVRKNI